MPPLEEEILLPRKSGTMDSETRLPPLHPEFEIPVLYSDENILIVDKPYDIRVDGDFPITVEKLVRNLPGVQMDKFRLCNQLDYATSGVLVLGKSKRGARAANALFSGRRTRKWYLALGEGVMATPLPTSPIVVLERISEIPNDFRMQINNESGLESETHVTPLMTNINYRGALCTLFLVKLVTGRRHQIRLHMKHIGYPIVGDATYHTRPDGFPRMMLHAWRLELPFRDDFTVRVSAPGDEDFRDLISDPDVHAQLRSMQLVS
jgi:tRNA pseudouridine32 synthase / 23S rRNA pseudouridine746 synthase